MGLTEEQQAIVDHDRVALPHERDERGQLRPVGVLAGHPVGEASVERHPFELAVHVLAEGADAHVADALPRRVPSFHESSCHSSSTNAVNVRLKFRTLWPTCQRNVKRVLF